MRISTIICRATAVVSLVVLLVNPSATLPASAAGAWYVAPDGADTNHCAQPATPCATISGALGQASPGDTLYVAAGTYTSDDGPVVLLSKNATLSGGWDAGFTHRAGASVIDGRGQRPDIEVSAGVTATLEVFTLERGYGYSGACIQNEGQLRVTGSTVRDCRPASNWDGAVRNEGTLVLEDSSVTHSRGIGVVNSGILTVSHTSVSDNDAGGIDNRTGTSAILDSRIIHNGSRGVRNDRGTVTLDASTVSDNLLGGGIVNSNGTMILNNSTVSGNAGITGAAGIDMEGGGLLILNSSTVSNNRARLFAGGISIVPYTAALQDAPAGGDTSVVLRNTLVAGNTTAGRPSDCAGSLTSAGYNLIGTTSGCAFAGAAGDLVDVDPRLGSLIGPPGAPGYQPLLPGSPAIDAGNPAGCTDGDGNLLATDQRGAPRAGRCDIGAYEYICPGPAVTLYAYAGTPQHAPPRSAFETPLQAAALDAAGSPVPGVSVLFTAPASGASGTFADTGIPLTTAITDERGVASAATLTANGLRGSYAVTATAASLALTPTYQLANIAWYVAPGGNDGNDCLSPVTPCATINGALQKPGQSLAPGDTIRVAVGVYTEAVWLNHGLALSGGWNGTFTAQVGTSTVDGQGVRAGIQVMPRMPRTVEFPAVIERFTIQNAHEPTFGRGGLYNESILTVRHSVVSHNAASAAGGGIYNEDGAALTISDSTISDNVAGLWGAGIYNDGVLTLDHSTVTRNRTAAPNPYNGEGGGIYNRQALTVVDSSISGNEANVGGGIYTNLLGIGETTLIGSAVVGNLAHRQGGGIFVDSGTVSLDNSTIEGNISEESGGGLYQDEDIFLSSLSLNNVTFSNNRAEQGGGIYTKGHTVLRNSILAGNAAPTAPDCLGTINSGGYNLIGKQTGECASTSAPGDLLGVSARLGPLMGSPAYHPLSRGSPAIDAGNPLGCADWNGDPLTTDQRGAPRPVDGNRDGTPVCDIGAYEYDPSNDPLSYTFVPMMLR